MMPTLTTNIRPLTIIMRLRPNHSARKPATGEAIMLPPSTAATISDVWLSERSTVLPRYSNAAAIIPTSIP